MTKTMKTRVVKPETLEKVTKTKRRSITLQCK